jgi:type IV secretion system protein VirD4
MDTYGSYAASDIFDNVGVEMVYGTGDEKLAKQLEERLGDTTMNVVTRNRPRWFAWANPSRQTEAEHPHRRPLMLASEIMQMRPDEQLILRTGMKPIRAKKIRWWQEPEFLDRQGPTPTIPKLEVLIAMDDGVSLSRPHRIAASRRT